ncbi:MAG: tetratricopeptide repeat protein [Acidobacteria bacterium]|nr:tetratricopeptide repeat protein [Acidobacteriota bacterium]
MSDDVTRPAWRTWLLPLLLVVAVALPYLGSLGGPFIFDDGHGLVENPHIRSLWPPWAPLVTPADSPLTHRPVASWTFAVNHALGGYDVTGYHVANLLFHLLAVLALFGLVRRTLELDSMRARFGAAAPWLAFVVALLWGLHPLVTEAVDYTVQRTEILFSLFYLLTLYAFARGLAAGERERMRWYTLAVVACALGMGSKEVMVSAPLAVLLYDRLFAGPAGAAGSFAEAWRRRRTVYLGLAATWLLLLLVILTGGGRANSAGFGLDSVGPLDYLRTQAGVIVHYLRLAVWPSPLVLDYDDWPIVHGWGAAAPAGLLVLALLALTVWALLRGRAAAFPAACFFLVLAPTSSVLPIATEVAAERRMYLPLAALVVLAVVGVWWLARKLGGEAADGPPKTLRYGLAAVALVLAVALAWGSAARNRQYDTALTILGDTVAKRPGNSRALNNYGVALLDAGRLNEAIGYFSSALEIAPDDSAHTNLGLALAQRGQAKLAVEQYRKALEINPDNAKTLVNLGNALLQQGQLEEAAQRYRHALEVDPGRLEAKNGLAVVEFQLGQHDEALKGFEEVLAENPDYRDAQFNLGMAYAQLDRLPEAEEHLDVAVRLDPDHARAQGQLALVLAQQGRVADAVPHFRKVVELHPDDAEAHLNLAKALAGSGRLDDALPHYEQAVALEPRSSTLAASLAWLYATNPDDTVRDAAKAVQLAETADKLSGGGDPVALDTLAAAYAEAGRFPDAVRAAEKAVEVARKAGRDDLAQAIGAHLTELRAGRPLRDG